MPNSKDKRVRRKAAKAAKAAKEAALEKVMGVVQGLGGMINIRPEKNASAVKTIKASGESNIEQIRRIMGQGLSADQVVEIISPIMKTYQDPQQLIDDLEEFKNMCNKPEFLADFLRCIPFDNFDDENGNLNTGLIGKIIEWVENTIEQHEFDRGKFKDYKALTTGIMEGLCTVLNEERNRKNGLISLSSLMSILPVFGLKGFNTNTMFKSLIKSAEDESSTMFKSLIKSAEDESRKKKMIIDVTSRLIGGMIFLDSNGNETGDYNTIMSNLSDTGLNTDTMFEILPQIAENESLEESRKQMIIDATSSLICGMITHDSEGKKIKDRERIIMNLRPHLSKINSVEVLKSVFVKLANDMGLDYAPFSESGNESLKDKREKIIIDLTGSLICGMITHDSSGNKIKDHKTIMSNLKLHQSKLNSAKVLDSVIDALYEKGFASKIIESENVLRFIKETGEIYGFKVEDQVDATRFFMLCTDEDIEENHYYDTLVMFKRLGQTSEDQLDKVLSFQQTYDRLGLYEIHREDFLSFEPQSLDRTLQMLKFFSENMPKTNVDDYEAKMERLIEQYKESNSYDSDSKMVLNDNSALISACRDGNRTIAKFLLDLGAKVDQTDSAGGTPLYYACVFGHTEIAKLLVEKDADIQKATNTEATPIFNAFKSLLNESTDMPEGNRIEAVLDYIAKKKHLRDKSLESAIVTNKQKIKEDEALEKIFDSAIKTIRRIKRAEYRAWLFQNEGMGNNKEELAQLGYLEKLNSDVIKSYFLDQNVKLDTLQLYFQDKYGDEYKSVHNEMTVEEAQDLQLINIRAYCEYIIDDIGQITNGERKISLDDAQKLITGEISAKDILRDYSDTLSIDALDHNNDSTRHVTLSIDDLNYQNDDFAFVLKKTRGIEDNQNNHSPVSVLRDIFNAACEESVVINKTSSESKLEEEIDNLRKEVYGLLDKKELNPEELAWLNKIKEGDKINKKEIIINQLEIDVKSYKMGQEIVSPNEKYTELVKQMAERQDLLEKVRRENNPLKEDRPTPPNKG